MHHNETLGLIVIALLLYLIQLIPGAGIYISGFLSALFRTAGVGAVLLLWFSSRKADIVNQ